MIPIADSSFVVALANRHDPDHARSAQMARTLRVRPWLPVPAITEICYVMQRDIGHLASVTFLQRLAGPEPGFALLAPEPNDYLRASEVMGQYADSGLDFVDAVIVALAERLQVRTLLTLDHRHLGLVRPLHCQSFELLPG